MKKHSLPAILIAVLLLFSACRQKIPLDQEMTDTAAPVTVTGTDTEPETEPSVIHPTGTVLDVSSSLFMTEALPARGNDSFRVFADENGFTVLSYGWSEGNNIHPAVYRVSSDGKSVTELTVLTEIANIYSGTIRRFNDGTIGFLCDTDLKYHFFNSDFQETETFPVPSEFTGFPYLSGNKKVLWYNHSETGRIIRYDVAAATGEVFLPDMVSSGFFLNGLYANDTVVGFNTLDPRTDKNYLVFADAVSGKLLYTDATNSLLVIDGGTRGAGVVYRNSQSEFTLYDTMQPHLLRKLTATGLSHCYDYLFDFDNHIMLAAIPSDEEIYYYSNADTLLAISSENGTEIARTTFLRKPADMEYSFSVSNSTVSRDGNIVCIPSVTYEEPDIEGYDLIPETISFMLWDLTVPTATEEYTVPQSPDHFTGTVKDTTISEELDHLRQELISTYDIAIYYGSECDRKYPDYTAAIISNEAQIENALTAMKTALSHYPANFFTQLKTGNVSQVSFYLAGTLKATNEYNLEYAGAFACTYGGEQMYVFDITDTQAMEQNLYHEIAHSIDRKLRENDGFDFSDERWNRMNPSGFNYLYSYDYYSLSTSNTVWGLSDGQTVNDIYFIDTYAKSYPTEDRARLMEYLMADLNSDCFKSIHLQEKLNYYFEAIRAGFDTSGWGETYWEKQLHSVLQ